jgi:hypothetical protein
MLRSLFVVLVLTATLTAAAFPAAAQPGSQLPPHLAVSTDFNGDGRTDLAVGTPGENVGATVDAGAVSVFYGVAAGTGLPTTSQTLVQANPEAGDRFGTALTVGFFNDDDFYDLAVGAPGEDVGARTDAGAVNVFYGSAGGLPTTSQVLLQDNPETGDRFGAALSGASAAGGILDLVVGAPGEDVGATVDAGAANTFSKAFTGTLPSVPTGPALLQDNPEAGDQFGAALVAGFVDGGFVDLVVGAPGENVGATVDAGAVNLFINNAGIPPSVSGPALRQDNPEAGDRFGAALTGGFFNGDNLIEVAVGAPGENVGGTVDAGAVNVFSNTAGVLPRVSGPALLQDNPETGDQFGAALTAKLLNGGTFLDLVVGAPGENVGATVDAGAANVFSNPTGVLPGVSSQTLLQGNVEAGDRFGAALDS